MIEIDNYVKNVLQHTEWAKKQHLSVFLMQDIEYQFEKNTSDLINSKKRFLTAQLFKENEMKFENDITDTIEKNFADKSL
jgi:hypothetical protein